MAAGGFVSRAFESMLKECTGKKHLDLQKAIHVYLDATKEIKQQTVSSAGDGSLQENKSGAEADEPAVLSRTITAALAKAGLTLEGTEVELVLNPLRLAIETKNLKILEPALDCLHKLIAYDHLEGDPGLDGGKNVTLFTEILTMVCSCFDNSSPDSTILQVLKVLLTAVASTKFRVHGEPLLGVIRVCYNIALQSKSPINQATSKAMLTQMISIVLRRMETDQVQVSTSTVLSDHTEAVTAGDSGSKAEETSPAKQTEKDMTDGDALSQVKENATATIEEIYKLAGGADIKGLEAALDNVVHVEDGQKIKRGIDLESLSIGKRDALLVFRSLCQMGMKEETDEVSVKTRTLSLELLQGLLEGVSNSFTKNFHFIDSVKAYLLYALLRALVSRSPSIFQYATGIFFVLLLRFRESLKGEIGVFFPLVVLWSLDSSECPINQKTGVLRMLEKVCEDPQMLVDIYVNYDCDPETPNMFERMVTTLSKIAQGMQVADQNSIAMSQATSVKGSSLQCLVNVLKSLVDWEKSRRKNLRENTQSLEEESRQESIGTSGKQDVSSNSEMSEAHKTTLEAAIFEFNRDPVKGVEHLVSNKLVGNDPASVAQFLWNTPNLDKAMIGDYIGQQGEFSLAVMHAYLDSMKFTGMKFDTAIRELLKGFRLPGEAQKIDRIMEKFAERYCADNPGLFKNADAVYVLAYAVIELNTDAHNPMVKPKMSKLDFIGVNAMNDPEECAPKELLEEIYDSIVKEEIQMKEDGTGTGKSSMQKAESEERGRIISILNLALPKRKSSTDVKSESEAIVKQTQVKIQNQGAKRGVFYTSQQTKLVRPMVEAVGWSLLATFSVTMGEGDNKPRIALCMEGFKAGIHITSVLGMDTMRFAFLTSLVRFTFLHAPKDMHSKNVEALRVLLTLCESEPESLQGTWGAVLECVSRLEYITTSPSISAIVMYGSNQISRDAVVQSLKELAGKPAEQIFVNSVKLSSESVVEFFNALCHVSAEELKQTPTRVYSLQKLVEISYYNMARIRMVWARIWSVLANHFVSAGCHYDEKVATYAIDSLKQLGMKHLKHTELANFTFQNDILKPFVVLISNSQSATIRRLIVECIVQMIKSKAVKIKSGWRSVFMIFTAAADDDLESIVDFGFENVEQVILEHFNQVVGVCFMDCVDCLVRFANNKCSHPISLKAIALLRICETRLAEGVLHGGALKPINLVSGPVSDVTEYYWFPMLAGLSELTSNQRPEVRSCALEVLFDLLNERGSNFSKSFWDSIFHRVLFPIFDHVRHAGKEGSISSGDEWIRENSVHSLQLLCNLFNTFYKEVCFMLPPLLSLLLDCAQKTDQTVVSISLGALMHLIEVGGHQFTEGDWNMLLKSIREASYTTQPLELLNALGFDSPKNSSAVFKNLVRTGGSGNYELDKTNSGNYSPLGHRNVGDDGTATYISAPASEENNQESESQSNMDGSEAGSLQRNQTIGQRIMGNMMDSLLVRSLTSKSRKSEVSVPSSPTKVPESVEPNDKVEDTPLMGTIRAKCITQLLLLAAIDNIQKMFWSNLKAPQKIDIMEILFSLIEFAASYNSFSNLRIRMYHIPIERPPLNILRQELVGASIYLDVLQKSTSGLNSTDEKVLELSSEIDSPSFTEPTADEEQKLEGIAEEKLAAFCEQVLKDASDLQSTVGETTNMNVHRVLELRSPVIIKVLKGMCFMNNKIFRRHLREFYPLLTKLVCCDQMDIRNAVADLFKVQLKALLP